MDSQRRRSLNINVGDKRLIVGAESQVSTVLAWKVRSRSAQRLGSTKDRN